MADTITSLNKNIRCLWREGRRILKKEEEGGVDFFNQRFVSQVTEVILFRAQFESAHKIRKSGFNQPVYVKIATNNLGH